MPSRGPVTNGFLPTTMPTGMHCPPTARSVMADVHCTDSARLSSMEPASNNTSCPHGPSHFQDLNSENGMGSNDQTELSRYRRHYSQVCEDLDQLKGQAKRRSIQMVSPAICAHQNKFLGKLLAKHNWDVAYASSSPCLMIYRLSYTSMTYTASYVRV